MMFRYAILLLVIISSLPRLICSQGASTSPDIYSPSDRPRMVAEWEPAIGVLIAWPLSIPKELVIELAADTKLYIMVDGHAVKQEVIQWLTKWRIMPDRVRFISAPQGLDASWTRDWGPHGVFTKEGDLKLGDAKYLYSTPVTGYDCTDTLSFIYVGADGTIQQTLREDQATEFISSFTEFDILPLPFAMTGGNVFTDGQGNAFSTCVITNENAYLSIPEEKFLQEAHQVLGIDDYHIISNFEEKGIQHIDCFMKMLDEDRLLVARPPSDHPAAAVYEGIIENELSVLKNAHGRPYEILRLDTKPFMGNELAAYTNSLILNTTVYVPLFGIAQDSVALQQWGNAMPGYTIKGFPFPLKEEKYYRPQVYELYKNIGWNGGDALHCRTRAIWSPTMIFMRVNRLAPVMPKTKNYTIQATIKDYSKGTLVPSSLQIKWRMQGETEWKSAPLEPTGVKDQFEAVLKGNFAGVTVEYYAEAKSNWGTFATMPMPGAKGPYTFSVN